MSGRILIEWDGRTYTIPEDEAFAAAEAVEEVVTLGELSDGKMRLTKVAKGYSALLRHCGAVVPPEAVHRKLVQAMADYIQGGKADKAAAEKLVILTATQSLLAVIMSGAGALDLGGGASKNPQEGAA